MENFKSKEELFLFIKSSISQDIILTGSTALAHHGLSETADECDLDIIICLPNEDTRRQLALLKIAFPAPVKDATTDTVKSVDEQEYDEETSAVIEVMGERVFLYVIQAEKPIKVHVFLKSIPQQSLISNINGVACHISRPIEIFKAKKLMSRKKDWAQLADVCSLILKA